MTQIRQMATDYLYKEETDGIIESSYDVYNALGYGFLERVYQNVFFQELQRRGFLCEVQQKIEVFFRGCLAGNYYADIVVNKHIVLEQKACASLCRGHEPQLINYLKSTDIEAGLLFNFGEHPQIRRKLFTNDRKINLRSSV